MRNVGNQLLTRAVGGSDLFDIIDNHIGRIVECRGDHTQISRRITMHPGRVTVIFL